MSDAPSLDFETQLVAQGIERIAGVDEAGRGPLAGPVTAAAVILDPGKVPEGLNDSKKLSSKRRAELVPLIQQHAIWAVAHASVAEIDALNILQASLLAMRRALLALPQRPDHALIDGKFLPKPCPCPASALIGGDARSLSISAASILAKEARDAIMVDLAQQHPGYGWDENAGYPTKRHISALRKLGPTPHHRRSFKPVHKML